MSRANADIMGLRRLRDVTALAPRIRALLA